MNMSLCFTVILGFFLFIPMGEGFNIIKKTSISLALSSIFASSSSISSFYSVSFLELGISLLFGLILSMPIIFGIQCIQFLAESFELSRGVSLASAISPWIEHQEPPLVTLATSFFIAFIFFNNNLLLFFIKIMINAVQNHDFYLVSDNGMHKVFLLSEKLYLSVLPLVSYVTISFLVSESIWYLVQKVFTSLHIQELTFAARTILAVMLMIGVLPHVSKKFSEVIYSMVLFMTEK